MGKEEKGNETKFVLFIIHMKGMIKCCYFFSKSSLIMIDLLVSETEGNDTFQ